MNDFDKIINGFSKIKLLVIGDIMLDRFIWGSVERISPEAPVPIVKVIEENYLLGGSANVLNNIISLGSRADICGVVGDDIFGSQIMELLKKSNINLEGVVVDANKSTVVKTRVVGHKQQIVRVDREDFQKISRKNFNKIVEFIGDNIKDYNAVILSDYGKGLINNKFYKQILNIIKGNNKVFNIDPKNMNMNLYKYPTLLTPNINEAGYAANSKVTLKNLHKVGPKLLRKFKSKYLIITLGEKGMAIFREDADDYILIPTVAKEVFDVTGAGDTVISVLTMAMALGENVEVSAKLSNIAAGIVVAKIGTATVSQKELKEKLYLL